MSKTKIIAMYLPQFHCIPENDEFWGKGFTDWVTVKKAKPLFNGHQQPRIPFNNNYYDLSKKENIVWQSKIAKEHGVYGFGIYHYWFNNEQNLLSKPSEIIRDNKEIDINYFFVWDNCLWRRSWSNVKSGFAWSPLADENTNHKGPEILVNYELGGPQDWTIHYHYVKTHFRDDRYIKVDGKPVFCIINYDDNIRQMCEYWNNLAINDGFKGVHFVFKYIRTTSELQDKICYNYEPHFSGWGNRTKLESINCLFKAAMRKVFRIKVNYTVFDYDTVWKSLIKFNRKCPSNVYPGAFVNYDDSPRRGLKGSILFSGSTPEKFKKYLSELYCIANNQNKEFIFLTAWNEWGEGAYLEPDSDTQYRYLHALKEVIMANK